MVSLPGWTQNLSCTAHSREMLLVKRILTINGQEHTLELTPGDGLCCRMDGVPFNADIAEVELGVYSLLIGGKSFTVRVAPAARGGASGSAAEYSVESGGVRYAVSLRDPRRIARGRAKLAISGNQNVTALMPGKVLRVLVSEGQPVESGQGLVVIEAMKMQNEIKSPKSGKIQKVLVRERQAVNAGDILLTVE